MTQRELIYFLAIAKERNISKAAETLFVAQPSLSRCLKKLESDLGVELFKRTPEGLKPTVAGEYYIKCANSILKTYKEMKNQISRLNELKAGRLTIGTTAYLGAFTLPDILSRFQASYPSIQINVVEDDSLGIENAIISGMVDFGILHTPIISKGVVTKTLVRERFFLAVPPLDSLNQMSYTKDDSDKKYIDIRLLDGREFILTHPAQRTRQVTDDILDRAGIKPHIRFLTKSIQTASRLAGMGLGLTLVPHSYSSLFSRSYSPGYYFIEPEFHPFWDLVICYSADMPLSRAAEEMIGISMETVPHLYTKHES